MVSLGVPVWGAQVKRWRRLLDKGSKIGGTVGAGDTGIQSPEPGGGHQGRLQLEKGRGLGTKPGSGHPGHPWQSSCVFRSPSLGIRQSGSNVEDGHRYRAPPSRRHE